MALPPAPDWDALWASADLPDDARSEWRQVMACRTRLPDDAVILARHGWTPADVRAARTTEFWIWPDGVDVQREPTRAQLSVDELAAWLVLADETAKFYDVALHGALIARQQYVKDLTERVDPIQRWSHQRVATLLGLSRQRVRAIAKMVEPHNRAGRRGSNWVRD